MKQKKIILTQDQDPVDIYKPSPMASDVAGLIVIYVLGFFVVTIFLLAIISIIRNHTILNRSRFRNRVSPQPMNNSPVQPSRLTRIPRVLNPIYFSYLPIHKYSENHPELFSTTAFTNNSCIICMSEFQSSEELRKLPCDHWYHRICIDKWLKTWSRECPVCKLDIADSLGSINNCYELHQIDLHSDENEADDEIIRQAREFTVPIPSVAGDRTRRERISSVP